MTRLLKQLLIFFAIPLLIIACQLLGNIWPVFNGVAFVLFALAIVGIVGAFLYLVYRQIFIKEKK